MKYLTRRSLNAALMATTIISTGTLLMPLWFARTAMLLQTFERTFETTDGARR